MGGGSWLLAAENKITPLTLIMLKLSSGCVFCILNFQMEDITLLRHSFLGIVPDALPDIAFAQPGCSDLLYIVALCIWLLFAIFQLLNAWLRCWGCAKGNMHFQHRTSLMEALNCMSNFDLIQQSSIKCDQDSFLLLNRSSQIRAMCVFVFQSLEEAFYLCQFGGSKLK